jgi:hypothetical protein
MAYDGSMYTNQARSDWPFDKPALYQISVQGTVPPNKRALLDGMTVTAVTVRDGGTVSLLVGELSDQVALEGVLSMLFELHLTVLSVNRVHESV